MIMILLAKNLVTLSIFQPEHMLVVFLAILLLFGGKKIPELMRGVGKGIREFKDAKDHVKTELEAGMNEKDNAELELKQAQEKLLQAQAKVQQAQQAQIQK